MVDVVVVVLALAASVIFGISAWVAVIAFRRARRGRDIDLPSYPFGGDLLGGGSARSTDSSAWLGDGGSASGSGDGGGT